MKQADLQKVMLVEDEHDIQTIASMALESIGGLTVEVCSSGREAIEKVVQFKPDLILLDVMMPGMDGPTTLRELRGLPEVQETPVVFLTAKVQTQEIEEYKQLGAIDVISKPFDPMTLPQMLKDIYAEHTARR